MNRKTFAVMMLVAAASTAMAGPLNPPPGPIAATMKTLAEFEARIAINATNTPGASNAMFVISQPGSYYLTGDVNVDASKSGIVVQASNVTIDLNGFTIKGIAGSVAGVSGGGKDRVKVVNGRIVGMSTGIYITPSTSYHQAIVLEDLVISQSTNDGVFIGGGALRHCEIERSGGIGAFITANTASTVEDCTFYDNGSNGLNMYSGTVRNSSASSNSGTGISVTTGTVLGCTAADNFVGITIEAGVVKDSTVQDNRDLGIRANGNALNSNNSISNNTFVDQSIGIQVQNTSGTRIEGNAITRMYVGVSLLTGNNYAFSNSFRGCTHAFNVAANNRIGTLVTGTASPMFIGNVGGGLGTTDPYANIIH